jgi:hypothetical protein
MVTKSLGDRMFESLFGSGNIDFKTDAEFSKQYALNGPDQNSVKNLFTSELRSVFTGSEKIWAAAGVDNHLVLFTDGEFDEQLEPKQFVDYLERTWEIFSIIRSEIKRETK